MNKLQITIWANAKQIEMVDNKITVKDGDFYFNGKKYYIENGEIKGQTNE